MKAIKNTYVKDRDKALLSLDEQQIRAFCKKYKVQISDNPVIFWAGVYKSILSMNGCPENARKQAEVLKKALTVAITVEFTSATDVIMSQKTKIDDDALKKMGVGWFKRKALKAALALSPESQKEKYEVKGNKVFFIDGKDRDTLTLSNDGKTLSGELDKDTKFTLKRTK